MLLKSLELNGFKTFPDKVNLAFDKGITAVVGPNGSGKSNVSDAIRWVLGEQSTKILRCSKMEDVIFNGTPIRRSKGYAEVALTIENLDRQLPFDNDEVCITRRYYRSGESEYVINNNLVRLKDIHELFMDTGLGRDGYSMIGQGKIDSIVSSKSENRREIFEEAAGISRYRYRKFEAEKKLTQADENLVRIKDIVAEIECRIEPLKEQSEKAKKYLDYSNEKKDLEIGLWLNTLDKFSNLLSAQESKISVSKNQHDEIENLLDSIQTEIEEVYSQSNLKSIQIEELRKTISEMEEASVRKLGEISVLENDLQHNVKNIERLEKEIKESDLLSFNMDTLINEKKIEIDKLTNSINEKKLSLDSFILEFNKLKTDMKEFSYNIGKLSSQLSSLSLHASESKVKVLATTSSINELELKLNAIKERNDSKSKKIDLLNKQLNNCISLRDEEKTKVNELMNSLNGYEIKLKEKQKNRDSLKQIADKLTLDSEEKVRRIRFLEELEKNMEGFNYSVKAVMKEFNNGRLLGIRGPISKLIKVKKDYAIAIEVALGMSIQNIVVDNENDAKKAIDFLKSQKNGRATFLPINTINGTLLDEEPLKSYIGFIGIGSNLCDCDSKYRNILKLLLGRVAIVDDLNTAITLSKKFNYKFKIVTLDGQVINSGGSLTGGSLSKNLGIISRVSEIEHTKLEFEKLKSKALVARNDFRKVDEGISVLNEHFTELRESLNVKQEEYMKVKSQCQECMSRLEFSKKSFEESVNEFEEIKNKIVELTASKKKAKLSYENYSLEIKDMEDQISKVTGNREALTLKREQISTKIQDIKLDIVSLEKDVESLNSEVLSLKDSKTTYDEKKKSLKNEIVCIKEANNNIEIKINTTKTDIENIKNNVELNNIEIVKLNNLKLQLEKKSIELRQLERGHNSQKETISRELARFEEQKINLQKEYDIIISSLWEQYELTRREAESLISKVEDVVEANKRLNELKLKIKNLGTINVSAIEEYKEVSSRYEFMMSQINDIEKSKKELLKLINDLTLQMKDLFSKRFSQINKNFHETFYELFGGGTAKLILTEPDNILNSGIEITVQLPGKIVSHLEALSGGEKALISIALYFAIMKVSPPPFCVLDEIEAALDDVNVDRFASYIHNICNKTQFIVITHRRGTMEQADVLYGVTMQDEGVSKTLELRSSQFSSNIIGA